MQPYLRFALVLLHVLFGVAWLRSVILLDSLRGRTPEESAARRAFGSWSRMLCRILRVKIRLEYGELAPGPLLLVGNHISWLDIPVIAAVWPVAFLSKGEVGRWPLIGPVATALGTLYIERGGRDAAADAAAGMRDRLVLGDRVLFFPEGTTSNGLGLRPFRPRLYQAAVDAAVPVQAFAISYHNEDGSLSMQAPFVDDDTMLESLLRIGAAPGIEARLRLAPPLRIAGVGRTELAHRSRETVERLRA